MELPAEMLQRMLSAPAGRETALVAEVHGKVAPRIVGLAQFVSVEHEDIDEVAVVVAEDWRRVGLATQLLRRLAATALTFGFRRAYAEILRDNAAALELARRFGAEPGASPKGPGLTRVNTSLQLVPPRPYY
jgi:RimJ/RimL family protein N-acetyltransferase